MEFKMVCLLVLGISSLSGLEAQECVAWGDSCIDENFTSLGNCCRGATCVPGYSGGLCVVDDTCIAGGSPCVDGEVLGECCRGYVCTPVPGPSSVNAYCATEKYYYSVFTTTEAPAGK